MLWGVADRKQRLYCVDAEMLSLLFQSIQIEIERGLLKGTPEAPTFNRFLHCDLNV